METLTYKNDNTKIELSFEDINSNDLLNRMINLMLMIWYSKESIEKSMDDFTF